MHGLPAVVVVWVKDTRKLFRYTLVTEGEDAGWAYEVTMAPLDEEPRTSGIDGVELEVVNDHVQLTQQVRARLGLSRVSTKIAVQSVLWKVGGKTVGGLANLIRQTGINLPSVKGGAIRAPGSWREYRWGHSKYTG
jgi:hypothetical protein